MRKSVPILEEIRKQLNVTEKKPSTDDMLFTVRPYPVWEPAAWLLSNFVADHVYPAMTLEKPEK